MIRLYVTEKGRIRICWGKCGIMTCKTIFPPWAPKLKFTYTQTNPIEYPTENNSEGVR